MDTDARCVLTELPVNGCAHCRGIKEDTVRSYGFTEPVEVIVPITRFVEGGIATTWAPYGNGRNKTLNSGAGHVHIVGPFTALHLRKILRTCDGFLYLVSCAPTQFHPPRHGGVLADYSAAGIGFQTIRLVSV